MSNPETQLTAAPEQQTETEAEQYAKEQTAPTDDEIREAGEFKYG